MPINNNKQQPVATANSDRPHTVHFDIAHSLNDPDATTLNLETQTSSACEGDVLHNCAPPMINLSTSGLRRSERIRQRDKRSGPTVVAYTSTSKNERPFQQKHKTGKRLCIIPLSLLQCWNPLVLCNSIHASLFQQRVPLLCIPDLRRLRKN